MRIAQLEIPFRWRIGGVVSLVILAMGIWHCGVPNVCTSDLECRRDARCAEGRCVPLGDGGGSEPEPTRELASDGVAQEPNAKPEPRERPADVSTELPQTLDRQEPSLEKWQGQEPTPGDADWNADSGGSPDAGRSSESFERERGDAGERGREVSDNDERTCQNDADCGVGFRCVNGACIPDNACQPACQEGAKRCQGSGVQVCQKQSGCERWGTTSPCPSGQNCQAGTCVSAGCRADGDCPQGKICSGQACVSCSNPCTVGASRCQGSGLSTCSSRNGCGQWGTAKACPAGEICKQDKCIKGCADDFGCASGQICVNNACVAGCRGNIDCAVGLVCVQLQCRKPCSNDSQCGGYLCRAEPGNSAKICGQSCQKVSDCRQSYLCGAGKCTLAKSCRSHADCSNQFACVRGRCATRCDLSGCINNHVCNASKDGCVPKSCRFDNECAGYLACVNGKCSATCQAHRDCRFEYYCRNGACTRGCQDDSSCRGFRCNTSSRRCVSSCIASSQCASGHVCVRPNCKKSCAVHSDCPEGAACLSRRCGAPCGSSKECKVGHQCVNSRCVAQTSCNGDADCGEGYGCSSGQCRTSCTSQTHCQGGFICNAGKCEQPPCNEQNCKGYACNVGPAAPCKSSCRTSADCWSGFTCYAGKCYGKVCQQSADCPYGLVCYMGACAATCRSSLHCASGFYCSGGRCIALPTSCVSSSGCPSTHFCSRGTCRLRSLSRTPYQVCIANSNCPSGYVCMETSDALDNPKVKRCLPSCNRTSSSSASGCSKSSECRVAGGSTSFRGAGGCFKGCTKNADCWSHGASYYCNSRGVCMDRKGVKGTPYNIPCAPYSTTNCPQGWDCVNSSYLQAYKYYCFKDCFSDAGCASGEVCRRDRGYTGTTSRMGCFRKCTFSTRAQCTTIRSSLFCQTSRGVCMDQ